MKNQNRSRTAILVTVFFHAVGCTADDEYDSESHFACQGDAECTIGGTPRKCVDGVCVLPALRTQVATDQSEPPNAAPDASPDAAASGVPAPDAAAPDAASAFDAALWDPRLKLIAKTDPGIYELALDENYVYWVDSAMDNFGTSAAVRRVPRDGGAVETLHTHKPPGYSIAVDDERVYVAYNDSTNHPMGEVIAILKSGGTSTVLAQVRNPTSIAVADGWLYYNQFDEPESTSSIWRIPTMGGTAELVVAGVDNAWDCESDGTYLYYSEMNAGSIKRVPVTGGEPTLLASALTTWLTLDGDDVLFGACIEGSCVPSTAYRVPGSGGAVTPILSVDYGRGKLSAGGGVVTFGDWIVPPGEAPFVLYPGDANHQCAGAISADGVAFLGDFTTGEIYRFQP